MIPVKKRTAALSVSGDMLKSKAIDFTVDFKASSGWLQGFKDHHGIAGRTICGETKAVDDVMVQHWNEEILPGS